MYLDSFLRKFNINLDDVNSFLSVQETKHSCYIPCKTSSHKPAAAKPKPPTEEELKDYIMTHPDETQRKIGEHFGTSDVAINALVKKYEIPYVFKKTIGERNEN